MSLSFRNVDADPTDPVETWPYEGLVAAIERGSVRDWARIDRALRRDPWGEVSRAIEDYLGYAEPGGRTALFHRAVARARAGSEASERAEVASRIRRLIAESGLSAAAYASRAGTSASRLSTYASGKVVPSAAMMLRLERVAARASSATMVAAQPQSTQPQSLPPESMPPD